MVRVIIGIVAGALVLAGCTSTVPGSEVANPEEQQRAQQEHTEPITAARVLGPAVVLNWCSLVDPSKLYIDQLSQPMPDLGSCNFTMGSAEELAVGPLVPQDELRGIGPAMGKDRGLVVYRAPASGGRCQEYLQFADLVAVSVQAGSPNPADSTAGEQYCAEVDELVLDIIETVSDNPKAVQRFDFPPDSWGLAAACTVVTPGDVAPPLDQVDLLNSIDRFSDYQQATFDGHGCIWGELKKPGGTRADL